MVTWVLIAHIFTLYANHWMLGKFSFATVNLQNKLSVSSSAALVCVRGLLPHCWSFSVWHSSRPGCKRAGEGGRGERKKTDECAIFRLMTAADWMPTQDPSREIKATCKWKNNGKKKRKDILNCPFSFDGQRNRSVFWFHQKPVSS